MKSKTTKRFRQTLASLPPSIQRQARLAYKQFKENPRYPGLRFKRVHNAKPIYSVRINRDYRAVAIKEDDALIWFWIGNHDEYEEILKK